MQYTVQIRWCVFALQSATFLLLCRLISIIIAPGNVRCKSWIYFWLFSHLIGSLSSELQLKVIHDAEICLTNDYHWLKTRDLHSFLFLYEKCLNLQVRRADRNLDVIILRRSLIWLKVTFLEIRKPAGFSEEMIQQVKIKLNLDKDLRMQTVVVQLGQ